MHSAKQFPKELREIYFHFIHSRNSVENSENMEEVVEIEDQVSHLLTIDTI